MAGSFSDYIELKLLDFLLSAASYTPPGTLYLALYTAAPTDSGGGTEVTGGAYGRLAITNNATNFPAASAGAKSNGADFTFTAATASWGTVVAWALFDAATSGNMLLWGLVTPNKLIDVGDTAKVTAGQMNVTLD